MTETRRAYHEELGDLTSDTVRLAVLARQAIHAGTAALVNADLSAADAVIEADRELDELADTIEERVLDLLALQQPMAVDLRTLMTILRAIHELERIGDHMINISKTVRRIYPQPVDPALRPLLERMGHQAMEQLALATEAFTERNVIKARALVDMDDVMDDLQRELFRAIFALKSPDDDSLQHAVQIALVGRYYERLADHAVNFGQRVEFMVTGTFLEHSEAH